MQTVHIEGQADLARKVVLQPDGKIVVSGTPIGSDPSLRTGVVRLDANGQLDPGFGSGGKVVLDAGLGRGLALQADGKLVLAGSAPTENPTNVNDRTRFAVMRLNADGSIDTSFGASGLMRTSISGQ